ncbi:MAG: ABC transporter permease [Planctomycetes bacterium]|nr:ABC transporter permease [Planctomycetota bacterium]
MRISDYLGQAGGNLWKKKLRTFLTTAGVVIGIGALVAMFAFGQGIQRNITHQFQKLDLFNYVSVFPGGGPDRRVSSSDPDAAGSRRARRRRPGSRRIPDVNQPGPRLDAETLSRIRAIEGVEAAFPELRFPAQIRLGGKEQFTLVQVLPAALWQSGLVTLRAGTAYGSDEPNELVISDSLLHRLGVPDPETVPGREIEVATLTLDFSLTSLLRMAFSSGGQALPLARDRHAFTVVGVAGRMGFMGPLPLPSDVLIPPGAAARMRKLSLTSVWDLFRPSDGPAGYATVSVRVATPQDVQPVRDEIEALGFGTFALMDQLREMRIGFLIMDMFLIAVGMIGITVASLGIANTMVMSILERYREIGIMKAVGATDGDVQRIFLFESGSIGLLGGLVGLGLGWLVSLAINAVINTLMVRQGAPRMAYFSFPWWLCLGAIAFSILISLLAGVYPTRRAARVDPVVALRHD